MFTKIGNAIAKLARRDPAARLAALESSLATRWSEREFEELRDLAAGGQAAAQHLLGKMYEKAVGVVQSIADAVHWYRLAADQGYLDSQIRLGLIFLIDPLTPASVTMRDGEQVIGGDIQLEGTLSQFFPNGVSVRQDFAEALKWNALAAEKGSAEAQARLGHQLALGLGTERNPVEAERWFLRAAEQGEPAGRVGLGLLYAGNYDTPPDFPRAVLWLGLAAEAGNSIAQYSLGRLLWRGEGVEETGVDTTTGRTLVRVDPRYFRPTEVETLLGDPTKARRKLGWTAEVTFPELVADMVESDLEVAKRDAMVAKEGYKVYSHHE